MCIRDRFIRDYCLYLKNVVGLAQSSIWIFMVEFLLTILYTTSQNHKLIGNCQTVQKTVSYTHLKAQLVAEKDKKLAQIITEKENAISKLAVSYTHLQSVQPDGNFV